MITVNFNTYNNYVTDSLYQWDKNQDLIINGLNLSVAPEIHFANANMDRAIVRQATLERGVVTVRIPNSLLQKALVIKAYVGVYEGDTFKVIETIEIHVIAKPRPYDYEIEDTDEEIYSFKALENTIGNIRVIEEKVASIADHIVGGWDNITNYGELDGVMRKYANGVAEVFLRSKYTDLAFQTPHNGFYANNNGRIRILLEGVMRGIVPDFCSVNVSKVTQLDENGEESFGNPMLALICGKPEIVEGYGVASPRILLLSDSPAEHVTVELEVCCRWKWNKQE